MNREQRDRMAETFVAMQDALLRSVIPTVAVMMDKMPDYPRPSYLPEVPPQSVGEYRTALAKLGKLGIVKGLH